MCCWIGERVDDLELLDDRTWPPVSDDQRQRVLVPGPDVGEMDIEPINFSYELREGIQPGLAFAPVVVGRPMLSNGLHQRESHALRIVRDRLTLRPPGSFDPAAKVVELGVRKTDTKKSNRRAVCTGLFRNVSCRHLPLLSSNSTHAKALTNQSVAVDFDDRVGEGLRRFLGKVVTNPTIDHVVSVFACELPGVRARFWVWCPVGVSFESDSRHSDVRGQ